MIGLNARYGKCSAALLALLTLAWMLTVHAARPYEEGLPTDWTHQYVIFSQPGTAGQVAQVANEPRYWQQWVRHHVVRVLSGEQASDGLQRAAGSHGDWSVNIGANPAVGAGNFPAKYSFSVTTANCGNAAKPDFVVFSTGLQSAATTASIIALDNLYSGCTVGTVPTLYWAYNTTAAAAGTVKTSPVLSLDGSQIAFVQTSGTQGTLVLLKWKANNGTLAAPAVPNNVAASGYLACTAPCMTTFPLKTGGGVATNDTISSVYYDYTNDTAWVGDSSGLLHKFTSVFKGTPAEVTTSPWPVQADPSHVSALTSPVYDHVSGNLFVGDVAGYISAINAGTGTSTLSAQVDHSTVGIVASPVLDQTAQKIYVFAANDGSTGCTGGVCAGIFQFSTTFSSGASGSETHVGAGSANPNPQFGGAFDSAYYSSTNATGNLYGCGHTGGNPILYQVPIAAGVMPAAGTVVASTTTGGSTAACSPVTDILNPNLSGGAEERLFLSPQNNGRPTACGGKGCVESFIVTPWQPSTSYALGQIIFTNKVHNEVVIAAGTSSTSPPTWTTTAGLTVSDGSITWMDQGAMTTTAFAVWQRNHAYALHTRILGTGGKVEIVTTAGTSNTTAEPAWPTTVGTTTVDGTVTWTYAGGLPTAALLATGGSSGVIMDNVVSSTTMAGGSQVYFSTLTNQACTTGGNGGCAVQASQSALQ